MTNSRLFLYLTFALCSAMLLRLALIEGQTFAVLFDGDLSYQTKISHLYQSTDLMLKNTYLEIAGTRGYLSSLMICLLLFRISFLPLDLFIIKRQLIKESLSERIQVIRKTVSDFKEQSKQVNQCYLSKGINTKVDVILLTFKIALMLFVFSIVINGLALEPQNWDASRGFINGFLGLFLFPSIYFANQFQPKTNQNKLMSVGLSVTLYLFSIAFFSVTLLVFILLMQVFNIIGGVMGQYFFVTLAKRKNHEASYG